MMTPARHALAAGMLVAAVALIGCGSTADLLAYVGGSLPPGEPDIGGVVLADVPSGTADATVATAALTPVEGAVVELYRGQRLVGRAVSGAQGYFRFERPDTGQYRIRVTPPQGLQLGSAERQVSHQFGKQTYVQIVLEPE